MSKKLLSIFVVLALALCILPVTGLPVTEAEATTVNHTTNLFPADTTGQQTANCPVCGGSQTWYELNTIGGTNGMNSDKTRTHYYLSEDYTMGTGWWGNLFGTQGRDICLHLNGNELTAVNRFFSSDLKKLNIIAGNGGSVIYTGGAYTPLFNTGVFNIYGGTYTDNSGLGLAKVDGTIDFYDVRINGNVYGFGKISNRTTLHGTTTINGIADFSATGSLGLTDWSGSITEYVPHPTDGFDTTTGAVLAKRLVLSGTVTGTIGNLAWNGNSFVAKAVIVRGGIAVPFGSAAAAAAAYTEADFASKNVIRMHDHGSAVLASGKSYYINACGKNVTVTGSGTLYPMDSANDKYDAINCGRWTIDTDVTVKNDVTNGNRYIAVKTGNVYTVHRLEMELTHVTLKTSVAGIYFKAEYKCDDFLAKRVTRYGVAVSKNSIPQAVGGTGVGYSEITTGFAPDAISHSLNTNSGAVVGIFKYGDNINNKERAETSIGARVYFTVDLDGTDTLDCLSAEGGSYSMYDVLNAIDTGWGNYNETQRTTVHNFYNAWEGIGAANCRIENLGFTKLPNTNELEYTLKVGYAYFDITPDAQTLTSLALGGRGSNANTPSGQIVDKLPGTCVAFKDENDRIVLMYTLDILGAYQDIMDFVDDISAGTGIPENHVLINTTHSHSAPHPSSDFYPQNAQYINGLKQKMITAGIAAIADLQPAQMYIASVTVPNMNSVRHYLMSDGTISGDNFGNWAQNVSVVKPVEDADNTLQLIKFVRDGSDILLMNWQGHPNRSYEDKFAIISGLEIMRQELLEKDMLLAFFLGASGNVNNFSRVPVGTTYYEQYGVPTKDNYITHYTTLANYVIDALDSFNPVPIGKLQVLEKTVSLVAADGIYSKNMSIYGFAIGDYVAFALAPYEMFNGSGLFIKENSPYAMTFVSTCAMGANSYIPTDEVYDFKVKEDTGFGDNHDVYEANGCLFARGTAEELAREYVTLLRELKAG